MPSFALSTLKKDLQENIDYARNIIKDTKTELEYTERVIRSSIQQKNYEEAYLKFLTEHEAPSEYEKILSQMAKNLFESSRPDRDAILNGWMAKSVALKLKIETLEQKLAELESLRVTEKSAAK